MGKKIVNYNPWGYQNTQQLFVEYIKPRFERLCGAKEYGAYYDYIMSVGIFRNWKYKHEFWTETKRIPFYIETTYQMCNNIKHYELTADKSNRYVYVREYVQTIFVNKTGNNYWTDDGTWSDDETWSDEDTVVGESNELSWKVVIKDKNKTEKIYLYELCKRAYEEIKGAISE